MLAKIDVRALHANDAARINDHEAHLRDAAHLAHRLAGLRQHIVLARHGQLGIEQHRQTDPRDLLKLPRLLGRVAVDDIDIRLLAERLG